MIELTPEERIRRLDMEVKALRKRAQDDADALKRLAKAVFGPAATSLDDARMAALDMGFCPLCREFDCDEH